MKQSCGEYSLNLNEPMGGTAGHAEHFFFMICQKLSGDEKPFKIQIELRHLITLKWKDIQGEIHGGTLTRLIQHPGQ